MTKAEREAIIDNGNTINIDISKISSCPCTSMDTCEKICSRYYSCQTIAYANDLLVEYEESKGGTNHGQTKI